MFAISFSQRTFQLLSTFKIKQRNVRMSQISILISLLNMVAQFLIFMTIIFATAEEGYISPFCIVSAVFLIIRMYIFWANIFENDENTDFAEAVNACMILNGVWYLIGLIIFGENSNIDKIRFWFSTELDVHSILFYVCFWEVAFTVIQYFILFLSMLILFIYPFGLQEVIYPSENVNNNTCTICIGEYENGDEIQILACKHSYHKKCINEWMSICQTCPICKASINLIERIVSDSNYRSNYN